LATAVDARSTILSGISNASTMQKRRILKAERWNEITYDYGDEQNKVV